MTRLMVKHYGEKLSFKVSYVSRKQLYITGDEYTHQGRYRTSEDVKIASKLKLGLHHSAGDWMDDYIEACTPLLNL